MTSEQDYQVEWEFAGWSAFRAGKAAASSSFYSAMTEAKTYFLFSFMLNSRFVTRAISFFLFSKFFFVFFVQYAQFIINYSKCQKKVERTRLVSMTANEVKK